MKSKLCCKVRYVSINPILHIKKWKSGVGKWQSWHSNLGSLSPETALLKLCSRPSGFPCCHICPGANQKYRKKKGVSCKPFSK